MKFTISFLVNEGLQPTGLKCLNQNGLTKPRTTSPEVGRVDTPSKSGLQNSLHKLMYSRYVHTDQGHYVGHLTLRSKILKFPIFFLFIEAPKTTSKLQISLHNEKTNPQGFEDESFKTQSHEEKTHKGLKTNHLKPDPMRKNPHKGLKTNHLKPNPKKG